MNKIQKYAQCKHLFIIVDSNKNNNNEIINTCKWNDIITYNYTLLKCDDGFWWITCADKTFVIVINNNKQKRFAKIKITSEMNKQQATEMKETKLYGVNGISLCIE